MNPPDLVTDAQSRFATPLNRHDMLKRGRLSLAMDSMELQWRKHPLPVAAVAILTNTKVATWLFVSFCLTTLIIAPLARLYGGTLFSPLAYELVCIVCG